MSTSVVPLIPTKALNEKLKCRFLAERALLSVLGVEYLLSVLRANSYPTTIAFDEFESTPWSPPFDSTEALENIVERFDESNCDVLFISVNTDYYARALAIVQKVKEIHPKIITCMGGPHATYAHKTVLENDCVDFVCRGEGEIAIIELMELIEGKRTKLPMGMYRTKGDAIEGSGHGTLVGNLDDLPFPDKSDYYEAMPQMRPTYSLMSGRGCYNKCTFCNSPTTRVGYRDEGVNFLRRRSVDDVILELKLAKERYNPTNIFFADDTFIFNKRYMEEFAEKYLAEIGLPYFCASTPNFFNLDIMKKLAKGGLANVEVGIQTLDPDIRKRIFGRPESNEDFTKYVRMLHDLGVYAQTDHIINPWATVESFKKELELYSYIKPNWISVFYLLYYPDTAVIQTALKDGYLTEDELAEVQKGKLKNSYFRGAAMTEAHIAKTAELATLLKLTPWLPGPVIRFFLRGNRFRIFKFVPDSIIFPLRFFNALLNKADILGRSHVLNLLRITFRINVKASSEQISQVKSIAEYKNIDHIDAAIHKLRVRTAG